MNIDEAVEYVGSEAILGMLGLRGPRLRDSRCGDVFAGRASSALLNGQAREGKAFIALAAAFESDVRSACKSPERLEREWLEDGSGRAFAEMRRRKIPVPSSAALLPARL